ncbi:hypothetical protein [Thalassovita aquimarina]|uniref:Uncharacterized protein n=1 Tax=Thalassovita aquimarina TaxID=2785917 RepID=A0ABS5HSG4_9RHOB|nr:hypothetical protein [Thalassovita aquimarina]MBR9651910.1 hypothetical protein [Thalassovita aquimarina]
MAQPKKKWVAFRTNATIPAEVVGEKEDKKVNAGEPVYLPAAYADHVVHDRFADPCEAPKKKAATKQPGGGQSDAEKVAAEAAAKLKAAQERVEQANVLLAGAAGTDGEEDARAQLADAEAELAALQPAT